MNMKQTQKFSIGLGILVLAISAPSANAMATAAEVTGGQQPLQEFQVAHCCHAHPYSPYDNYCCHPPSTTVYVAPAYGVGPASVRGVSRRTSRRVSRRR